MALYNYFNSLALNKTFPKVNNNIGVIMAKKQKYDLAKNYFLRAISSSQESTSKIPLDNFKKIVLKNRENNHRKNENFWEFLE